SCAAAPVTGRSLTRVSQSSPGGETWATGRSRSSAAKGLTDMPMTTDRDDLGAYLEELTNGRFVLPQCDECGRPWWPPRSACPRCQSSAFHWIDMPQDLSLYTFTVVHRTQLHDFAEHVPYAVGILEDSSGDIQVVGRLGADPESVTSGDVFRWSV